MMNMARTLTVFGLAIVTICSVGGCSIRHIIADDYTWYLAGNQGKRSYPQTDFVAEYVLTPDTAEHRYEFRCFTAGVGHLWIVDFGRMLESMLESDDVQAAFKEFSKVSGDGTPGVLTIEYDLLHYEFAGFRARVRLRVSARKDGSTVFSQTYSTCGRGQGGKVAYGGAFTMKNAIQQSTKSAMDQILSRSLSDMKASIQSSGDYSIVPG